MAPAQGKAACCRWRGRRCRATACAAAGAAPRPGRREHFPPKWMPVRRRKCDQHTDSRAHQDDADRDRARMQADRTIAERELRLQERHDIALQVDGIEIEAGEQPAIPGGASDAKGGVMNCSYLYGHCSSTRSIKVP